MQHDAFLLQDVQKHSVHTLVFRSLKRTHDMFVSDHAKSISLDDERWVWLTITYINVCV